MEALKPNYYAIIPADVRYDKQLSSSEKLLYAEITALTHKEGYCWATNAYFAELYSVDRRTIQRWLDKLKKYKYIKIQLKYVRGTKQVESRKIWIKDSKFDVIPSDNNATTPHGISRM
ncbi:MAG: helix-turn-helix domain-containing protein [Eubacteriales bacterium]